MTFGDGKCVLTRKNKEVVGVVFRTATRVYKVEHEDGFTNAVEERLTLEKFYRCMGHIAPETSRKLVKDRLVTGVQLEYTPYGSLSSVLRVSMPKQHRSLFPSRERVSEQECLVGKSIQICGGQRQ